MRKSGSPHRVTIMPRKKKTETAEVVSQEQVAENAAETKTVEPVMAETDQAKTPKKTTKATPRPKKTAVKKEPATQEKATGEGTEMPVEKAKPKNKTKQSKKVEIAEEKEIKEVEQPIIEKEKNEEAKTVKEPEKKAVKEKKEPKQDKQPQKKTRAEKNEAIHTVIKELLAVRPHKWSELLEESAKLYSARVGQEEGETANDLRGRIGSVVDVMKKESEVMFDGGMYALKARSVQPVIEEKPVEIKEETKGIPQKKEDGKDEKKQTPEKKEEVKEETKQSQENKTEIKTEIKNPPAIKAEAKVAPVFDMSVLFAAAEQKKVEREKQEKKEEKPLEKAEQKPVEKPVEKPIEKPVQKSEKAETEQKKTDLKPSVKKPIKEIRREVKVETRRAQKTADEKLKEAFLRKIRSLGGKYFEYYTIYLLERYSMRNGRRIEGLRVSGNEHDGGIDGELEVSDRLGFRETIYVQSKNWNPMFGKEESWVVGETLLQQFIGAVAYRQAKEGKQHCRGIFMTASYFTAGAKEMLDQMSDKFVGYDGDDLYEAAKECGFGIIRGEKGEYVLDEKLLSGDKAFFALY